MMKYTNKLMTKEGIPYRMISAKENIDIPPV
jgi:hypothetical protein